MSSKLHAPTISPASVSMTNGAASGFRRVPSHHSRVPDWVFKRMGDLGLLGVRFPPEYGGQGGDWGHAIVVAEEMARSGSGGVGMAVAVQTEMATPPILKFGSERQKQRWLVPAIKGER